MNDIENQLYPLLLPDIINAFNFKVTSTVAEYNELQDDGTYVRRLGYVRYFGTQCRSIEEGIPKLAEKLNTESKNFKYLGTFGSFSMELANLDRDNKFMVLSYFLLSKDDYENFDERLKTPEDLD